MPCPRPRQNACTLHVELNEPLIIGWAPIKSRDCSGPGNRIVGQSVLGLKGPQLLGEHFIEDCSLRHSQSPTEHSDPFALISGAQQGAIRNFDLWQAIPMVAIFPVSIAQPTINRAHPPPINHLNSKTI